MRWIVTSAVRRAAMLAVMVLFVSLPLSSRQAPPPPTVVWETDLDAAIRAAAKDGKKVLVDIYAPWCGYCKLMQQRTYTDPEIADYITKKYHAVRLNGESQETIKFQGQEFGYMEASRVNQLAYLLMNGRVSYPTTVFLNGKSEVLSPVVGYLQPKEMAQMLRYFGDNHYQTTSWTEFSKGGK